MGPVPISSLVGSPSRVRTRAALARVSLVVMIVSSACRSTVPDVEAPYEGHEPLVIGRTEFSTSTFALGPIRPLDLPLRVHMLFESEGGRQHYQIETPWGANAKSFHVALPPGLYAVTEVVKGNWRSCTWAQFQVPESRAVYIGSFRAVPGSSGVVVNDEYDAAIGEFRGRYPGFEDPVSKDIAQVVEPTWGAQCEMSEAWRREAEPVPLPQRDEPDWPRRTRPQPRPPGQPTQRESKSQ